MAIKRYLLPGILAFCAYLILGFIFSSVDGLYTAGLVITILNAYFIRVCDDISDFEKDRRSGKALLGKKMLICLATGIFFAVLVYSVVFSVYWAVLPLIVISAQLLFKEKYRDFFKPLFIPVILISLFNTVFVYSNILPFLIIVAIIIDIGIILQKR